MRWDNYSYNGSRKQRLRLQRASSYNEYLCIKIIYCTVERFSHNESPLITSSLLPPATKLGQGNVFTSVCDSVHRWGVRAWPGGACGGHMWLGCVHGERRGMLGEGGHAWRGGMHGEGGQVWWRGGVCGKGGCAWQGGHAWQRGGHAWQRGAYMAKGGHAWQSGVCMAKAGCAWRKGEACMVCTAPPLRDIAGQCAGGRHATGMHSCFASFYFL